MLKKVSAITDLIVPVLVGTSIRWCNYGQGGMFDDWDLNFFLSFFSFEKAVQRLISGILFLKVHKLKVGSKCMDDKKAIKHFSIIFLITIYIFRLYGDAVSLLHAPWLVAFDQVMHIAVCEPRLRGRHNRRYDTVFLHFCL